ncbi:MAG: M23 family metallopeptidase [Chloroflexi bacterium]|nr:M23 family metallopeptidase [Chloroflexota bacterium]
MTQSWPPEGLCGQEGLDDKDPSIADNTGLLQVAYGIYTVGHRFLSRSRKWIETKRSDIPFLSRYVSHLAALFLTLLITLLANVRLSALTVPRPLYQQGEASSQQVVTYLPSLGDTSASFLISAVLPHTIIPERPREEVITYVVEGGDTVSGIAEKFGITDDTLLWSNPSLENNPDLLSIGQKLAILPVEGVYHEVEPGDTIAALAKRYKVAPEAITNYPLNNLNPPYVLSGGMKLVIPGGSKPFVPRIVHAYRGPAPPNATKGTGNFGWPVTGHITQGYSKHHRAIDIGASWGSPVFAADSGYISFTGWDRTGYGNMILIDHGNGFLTRYAHLSQFLVKVGQSVTKGTVIAKSGSTGNSTGPHLHFEVIKNGVPRNPFNYLR